MVSMISLSFEGNMSSALCTRHLVIPNQFVLRDVTLPLRHIVIYIETETGLLFNKILNSAAVFVYVIPMYLAVRGVVEMPTSISWFVNSSSILKEIISTAFYL